MTNAVHHGENISLYVQFVRRWAFLCFVLCEDGEEGEEGEEGEVCSL